MMMFESHKYRQAGEIGQDKGRRIPSTGWALVQRHSYDCTCIEWCHVIIINVSCVGVGDTLSDSIQCSDYVEK